MTEVNEIKSSRIGKQEIAIPAGVDVKIVGQEVTVKGPQGESSRTFRDEVRIVKDDAKLRVDIASGSGKRGPQFQGMSRSLLANMVEGVHTGFKRSLDLRGVGYRADFKNGTLTMSLGLSHQVVQAVPESVKVNVETIDVAGMKYPRVNLESFDKEALGQVADRMGDSRPPLPYKV